MKKYVQYFTLATILSACGVVAVEPVPVQTIPEFVNYVAVGNSWAAGYMNGGLYQSAQMVSYPNLIAQQLQTVVANNFSQPLFSSNEINGTGYLTGSSVVQTTKVSTNSVSTAAFSKYTGANNNFGVVGLRMGDVVKVGLGNSKNSFFNPFYGRLLTTAQADKTYIELVAASKPTFFTLSLGDEDVRAFATSGGKDVLTDVVNFSSNIQKLLDALTANGASGVVANVPDFLSFPYFNYYTYDQFRVSNGNADIYIMAGNGVVRKAVTTDLFLLKGGENFNKTNAQGVKKGSTAAYPMANEEVLDGTEIANVNFKIQEINQIIAKEATARKLPVVDLNAIFKQLKAGTYIAKGVSKVDYGVTNSGIFSLDALNPTPRGYAIIANEFIKTMNTNYKNLLKSEIPLIDVSKFAGI